MAKDELQSMRNHTRPLLRFTFHVSRPFPLLLILLLFTLLTLYNSVLLPLGEAADETDHYQYLRFVARTGHPPLTEAERAEAGFKGGLAPLYYWLAAWPITLVGEETPPDIRRIDSRPERYIPTDGLGINHVLHTLDEQWPLDLRLGTKPWRGQILAWHLVRFLSLPLGWVTIIATYALARRLLPGRRIVAVGAAAFVAFLPRFVISSAVINDDNLVFALTALLLLTQVIILQGNHQSFTFAIFGALFGLALVTKYFSLILIPEILLTLIIFFKAAGSRPGSIYRPLLAFLAALLITAGPWFSFITIRFNRIAELGLIAGLTASLGEPQITEGLVGLLSGQPVRPPAATYGLPAWLSLLYRSFWFEYGWMQIFAPGWVYSLFTIILLVALGGILGYVLAKNRPAAEQPFRFRTQPSRGTLHLSPVAGLLSLHLALFCLVVLARFILSATIDTGQGRHLYPALPVIALLIALGLDSVGSSTFPDLSGRKRPRISALRLVKRAYTLIPVLFFLLPALISLQPTAFILPHYQTLPVTITPPTELAISHHQNVPFAGGLTLAGYNVPQSSAAGDVLPVTLYWRAGTEADRDYLVSLCLQDSQSQPAACWRGHFVDGRYPVRAWEAGDTVIDTIFIPIPTCNRLLDQTYTLQLEVWPLALDSSTPVLEEAPVLAHTLAGPPITLQPTDSPRDLPQTIDLWRRDERLTGLTRVEPGESIAQLRYAAAPSSPAQAFQNEEQGVIWKPLPQLDTPLFLPCDDGPAPLARLAHFIAEPTLPGGQYRPTGEESGPTLTYAPRSRLLSPLQSTLTFARLLAPLSLQLPGQPEVDLTQPAPAKSPTPREAFLSPASPSLPVTIRWQTHRWMADPLVISLKLLDKDFAVGGERIATLGDRYPNVLWVPTEVVEETYPVYLRPDAPPGLYQLELSLIRQDETLSDGFEYLPLIDGETAVGQNLYPATVRLLDPAHDSPPPTPFIAQLGNAIQLVGYDLQAENINLQSPISLGLYWQSTAKIPLDYTVFTQLIGPDGQVWAQWDNPPQAGRYPTTAWAETDRVVDRYSLPLQEGAPPGEYRLLVGMYDPATGERLPVTIEGQPQPDNAVELARLSVAP